MSQPTRWLWGVVPLALLWGTGNFVQDDAIQRDVAVRAERAVQAGAGAAPGAKPVTAQVEGRDVTIGGEVISADGAAKAMTQLRSEFGVRRALGGLSQVVAQKPYSWFVSRLPNVVTIGGFVPDLSVAENIYLGHMPRGFGGIEEVRFRGQVKIGDRLVMVAKALRLHRRHTIFECQGFVGTNMVFHGNMIGVALSPQSGGAAENP